jgi:hypothetical protein
MTVVPVGRTHAQADPLRGLFEDYAAGRAAQLAAGFAKLTRAQADTIRAGLFASGHSWITEQPQHAARRALIVATVAIELEAARIDRREWMAFLPPTRSSGRQTIAVAAELLKRRQPDNAELAWWRVAIALGEANLDRNFTTTPPPSVGAMTGWVAGLEPIDVAGQAAGRFPAHPEFPLARAWAYTTGLRMIYELESPHASERHPPRRLSPPVTTAELEAERKRQHDELTGMLRSLLDVDDKNVAAEAGIRLAYVHWTDGDPERALTTVRRFIDIGDVDRRYLARILAGQIEETLGHLDLAEGHFTAALQVRPGSQSATLALAALHFRDGAIDDADSMVRASITSRGRDDDPWRMFPYGEFTRLPVLMERLRAEVMR